MVGKSTKTPLHGTRTLVKSRHLRSKEEAHDYRYFPDPDLMPLEIEQAWVDDIAATLPELAGRQKARVLSATLACLTMTHRC